MVAALNHKIYLRGALSIGNYIEYQDKYYLGDAIYDAASWYDKAESIGIIITPNTGKHLDLLQQKIIEEKIEKGFIDAERLNWNFSKINAPIKNKSEHLWVINWPIALSTHGSLPEHKIDSDLSALGYYYSLISLAKIPFGTELKYNNTNQFVEYVFKKFPRFNNILRPDNVNYPEFNK